MQFTQHYFTSAEI